MEYGVCFYIKEKDWQITQKIILHTYLVSKYAETQKSDEVIVF